MKEFTLIITVLFTMNLLSYGQVTINYEYIETASSEMPDLAIDANDHLHAVYYKKTGWPWCSVYAYNDGSGWVTEDIVGTDGLHSIAVDNSGNPHVMCIKGGNLHYAWKTGATWNNVIVDSSDYCHDNCITVDANGHLHVSYTAGLMSHYLKYAYYDGSNWITEIVDSTGGDGNSICTDSNNAPHIAYGKDGLSYAYWNGNAWDISNPYNSGSASGVDGFIAIDGSDNIHLSYQYDQNPSALGYKFFNGSNWTDEQVDVNQNMSTTGIHNSICIDNSNNPHIGYAATDNWVDHYPKYAYYNGSAWNYDFLDTTEVLWMSNMVPVKVVVTSTGYAQFVYTVNSSKTRGSQIKFATTGGLSSNEEIKAQNCLLIKNYPNPANTYSIIEYQLNEDAEVELIITDQLGRVIKKLNTNYQSAGIHKQNIDIADLAPGSYFYILKIDNQIHIKKLSILR